MPRLEHFAINVADPLAVTVWWCEHLGFILARRGPAPAFTTFLRDPQTGVMIEIYRQTSAAIPDYAAADPLTLHVAFATESAEADKTRLLAAGATCLSDATLEDGTRLLMLRDPFGICIQFCQRAPGFFKT